MVSNEWLKENDNEFPCSLVILKPKNDSKAKERANLDLHLNFVGRFLRGDINGDGGEGRGEAVSFIHTTAHFFGIWVNDSRGERLIAGGATAAESGEHGGDQRVVGLT